MAKTQNEIIKQVTSTYLASLSHLTPPSPAVMEERLLDLVNAEFDIENTAYKGADRFTRLKRLTFSQVAQMLITLHKVVRVAPSDMNTDRDYDLLAIYVDEGEDEGTYVTSEDHIRSVARLYNRELTLNEAKEVMAVLHEEAPRVTRCSDRDLIAVNNGIFNYKTKRLHPFNPQHVFLSKVRVDYVATAQSPGILTPDGETWEVEDWIRTLSDDDEVIDLLWEILGAIVRPHVRWNKSAWFYSEQGNNGKGTLVELMRNLVGTSSYASIPIADFGKDFMLEPLTRANAILVDENDVGTFVDRAANLKAIITNDVISINRKNKVPIAYQFWGFMVQCLNEFPRIKDKSESFYRRQLFVPFEKCFTGAEKRYIKDDYVARDDVLQYVLKRVLHMNYYTLSEPAATKLVLAEYKGFNDPIRAFWEELEEAFVWDLLPFQFLYDLYKAWFARNNPSGSPVGKQGFNKEIAVIVQQSPLWYCPPKGTQIRSSGRMSKPEPLIATYDLRDWMDQTYTGKDVLKKSIPSNLAAHYRGVQRLAHVTNINSSGANEDDDQTAADSVTEEGIG